MIRTQEIITLSASELPGPPVQLFVKAFVTSAPLIDPSNQSNPIQYPTKNVIMAPMKVMANVIQVCLYEALILLLSHDMQQFEFEVDSLFCAAGPNVQVPKQGVSTSAG